MSIIGCGAGALFLSQYSYIGGLAVRCRPGGLCFRFYFHAQYAHPASELFSIAILISYEVLVMLSYGCHESQFSRFLMPATTPC